jgi:hypothetical protein
MERNPKGAVQRFIAQNGGLLASLAAAATIATFVIAVADFSKKAETNKRTSISSYRPTVTRAEKSDTGRTVEVEMIAGVSGADAKDCKGQLVLPSNAEIDSSVAKINGRVVDGPLLLKPEKEYRLTFVFHVPRSSYADVRYRLLCDGVFTPLTPVQIFE